MSILVRLFCLLGLLLYVTVVPIWIITLAVRDLMDRPGSTWVDMVNGIIHGEPDRRYRKEAERVIRMAKARARLMS